ncbi:dihydroxy-acid dehydratase [Rubellimicrobium sp. CFH 75288]|uniref:dihydroxy-acid dehydratase n=1 Tax=Rubellimicrobium sp. CFH 75288 TaxID=2697034 RepID=UPI001AA0DD6C|nr:dihydroxy-acid dehydratase [Rubellimicrobium sp. CFH 75288]
MTRENGTGPARLRSDFRPGSTRWAVRRAQWLAMGIAEEDFAKPKIAVVNSSSTLSICFSHLDAVSRVVQEAIRAAGGLPFEIRTVAPSDFVTSAGKQGRYLMPSRDLLVNDVEVQVEGAVLDAVVFLASCDKTTPGQLMAAGRLDLPAIIVPCGYQLGGACGGRDVDIEDLYKGVGTVLAGRMTLEDLTEWSRVAIRGPGVCAGLGTANSMHILAEALGMTLPGAAPVRGGSEAMARNAAASGRRILELLAAGVTARQVLTPAAFRNAVRVATALGLSVNCVRHLIAAAIEAEAEVDILAEFRAAADLVPLLAEIRPNGPRRIEELEAAGGARGVLRALRPLLEDGPTVAGSVMERLEAAPEPDPAVIGSLDRPVRAEPGIILIRGNLAPIGAIVKLAAVPPDIRRFEGPARIFEDEDAAIAALGAGGIRPGDVIVLRMLGPLGGPGTVFAASFMAALVGSGLGEQVAVVTDGELSGLNRGITIGQIMPEAAEGGPLAVVEEGDRVRIDLCAREIAVDLDDGMLAARLAAWKPPPPTRERGWLRQYRALVQPLSRGAVLRGGD